MQWAHSLSPCSALELDGRNFHAWGYRQFLARRVGLSAEEELAYAQQLICQASEWRARPGRPRVRLPGNCASLDPVVRAGGGRHGIDDADAEARTVTADSDGRVVVVDGVCLQHNRTLARDVPPDRPHAAGLFQLLRMALSHPASAAATRSRGAHRRAPRNDETLNQSRFAIRA